MQPIPAPDETRANQNFKALLGALSRPGQIHNLAAPGEEEIIQALIDRECRVFCVDPGLGATLRQTGALMVEPQEADHLFLGTLSDLALLHLLSLGSDLNPDDGATVVIQAGLSQSQAQTLRLSGPGIDTALDVAITGLPNGFWSARRDLIRYPMGFDLFLLDGADVMGIPRSTMVEVL